MPRRILFVVTILMLAQALGGCGSDDSTQVPSAPRIPTLIQITDTASFEANPTFSPDGSWILYESDVAGNMDIYRIPATGGQAEQLTSDPGFDSYPSWSGDGSQIVFESDRDGNKHLWVLILDTPMAQPQQLTQGDYLEASPMWSPDGSLIVFESNQDKGWGSDLWTVPAGGGQVVRLTTTGDGVYNRTADWSPDSDKLVFESNRSGSSVLYTMPRLGGTATRLTVEDGYEGHPAWSPDGGSIAFESAVIGDSEIFIIAANGGEALRLTVSGGHWPSFSPNGQQIVFCIFDDVSPSIWVLDVVF